MSLSWSVADLATSTTAQVGEAHTTSGGRQKRPGFV
jgi:hypothetical protein